MFVDLTVLVSSYTRCMDCWRLRAELGGQAGLLTGAARCEQPPRADILRAFLDHVHAQVGAAHSRDPEASRAAGADPPDML